MARNRIMCVTCPEISCRLDSMKSMPDLRSRVVVAAALFLAASVAGRAQTIAELPENRFQSLVEKTDLYVKALKDARSIQRSYDRYASWVDVKKGPTGKEPSIESGLPEISNVQEIVDAGKKGPGMWPPLPNVDIQAQKLAEITTALTPLVKSASDYYAQHTYKNDAAKRGQELHLQMMPLFEQAFAAEAMLRFGLRAVKDDVDRRILAQLEKEHGKNYEWYLRTFLMAAETLADLLPNHLDAPMIEGARYKQRFANLEAAYTALMQFRAAHAEEIKQGVLAGLIGNAAEDFFAASKLLRNLLEMPKLDKQIYLAKVNDFATKYEDLLQRARSPR
jgi:hypothetical protein